MKTPVLLYHSICNDNSNLSLNTDEFEKQIIYLKKKNFKSISLDQLNKSGEKNIIITFDDTS